MRDILLKIMDNYLDKKEDQKSDISKNFRKECIYESEQDLENILRNEFGLFEYDVKCSFGLGNWSSVPWIMIKHEKYELSAQKDYYIVYLFNSDMSGVYLSLNQGWTSFEKTYQPEEDECAEKVTKYWRKELSHYSKEFTTDIDLKKEKKKSLANGYERCHIFGKFYPKSAIPDNNTLKDDLKKIIHYYDDLRTKLVNGSANETNNQIINSEDKDYYKKIRDNINELKKKTPTIVKSKKSFTPKKINHEAKSTIARELELNGELAVLKNEKKYLINNNRPDLAEKVEHISQTKGDGAGYDILSYDLNENEKYIEVKTTSKDENHFFFITDNEIEFSKKYPDNYSLYRIYNFKENEEISYFEIKGDLTDKIEFKPITYRSMKLK